MGSGTNPPGKKIISCPHWFAIAYNKSVSIVSSSDLKILDLFGHRQPEYFRRYLLTQLDKLNRVRTVDHRTFHGKRYNVITLSFYVPVNCVNELFSSATVNCDYVATVAV